MAANSNVLAVIFDFDDTLTEDSTSALLAKHKINTSDFWAKDVNRLVTNDGWEPTNAYLHLFLKYIDEEKLPAYTNKTLREFGETLKPYPGLPQLFKDLRKTAKAELFEIEFYIISGGFQEIIEGFRLRGEFKAVWGCQLAGDKPNGPLRYVKRAITFTEKTRYIYVINKGLDPVKLAKNPYLVNEDVPEQTRRIPFSNMIYIGDGLSDIPCISVITKHLNPGFAFGVFEPGNEKSAKSGWTQLLAPNRVISLNAPKYGRKNELGSLLRAMVASRCLELKLRRSSGA